MPTAIALALIPLLWTPTVLQAEAPSRRAPELSAADRAWMRNSLEVWRRVRRDALGLAGEQLPWIVFFDDDTVWHLEAPAGSIPGLPADAAALARTEIPVGDSAAALVGFAHGGEIALPDGGRIPPRLMLFASTWGEPVRPYLVMAMPGIWRAAPQHASEDPGDLDLLISGVFVHEMTHTCQAPALGRRIDALVEAHGLDDSIDDDIVQTRFSEVPGFAAEVDRERDLLFRAASASTLDERLRLAADALVSLQERRSRFYTGELAYFAELEDVFLYMEGVANWAACQALVARGVSPEDAVTRIRRGGRFWSQDEGLGLLLAIEALSPGWKARAFSDRPGLVVDLLARAIEEAERADR